jgi:predicted  nucleic acid-binding Zn-ribbon protein
MVCRNCGYTFSRWKYKDCPKCGGNERQEEISDASSLPSAPSTSSCYNEHQEEEITDTVSLLTQELHAWQDDDDTDYLRALFVGSRIMDVSPEKRQRIQTNGNIVAVVAVIASILFLILMILLFGQPTP